MDFSKALLRMKQGKKVRRNEWPYGDYAFLDESDGILTYYETDVFNNEQYLCDVLCSEDLLADDWEVAQ